MKFFSMFKLYFKWTLFLFFYFFRFSIIHADDEKITALKKGETLFAEKLYADAIPHYHRVLSESNEKNDPIHSLLYRLAACHLMLGNGQECLKILSNIQTFDLQPGSFFHYYLTGLAAFHFENYQEALSLFSHIPLESSSPIPDSLADCVALEKGRSLFYLSQWNEASKVFQSIPFNRAFPLPFYLAQLNLVKIHLREQDPANAHLVLNTLNSKLPPDHPLEIERIYLTGTAFFLEKNEIQGTEYFERLLPKAMLSTSPWSLHVLETTLCFYLKQLSNESLNTNELLVLLTKGEGILNYFSQHPPSGSLTYLKIQELKEQWLFQKKKIKALVHIQSKKWNLADLELNQLLNDLHLSPSVQAEIWYWRGYCAEQMNDVLSKNEYFEKVYSLNPNSPFAPSAYFKIYSFQEYLQGSKLSLSHLKSFVQLFPNHPLNMTCCYLLGLHFKNPSTLEVHKHMTSHDLSAACDMFERGLNFFDLCLKNHSIRPDNFNYFSEIYFQTLLEKAKTLFMIADQSKNGKKKIYLKYAEDHFYKIVQKIDPSSSLHSIWAEGAFKLNEVLKEQGKQQEQKKIIEQMIHHLQSSKSSWLAKAWIEKGKMAQQSAQHFEALESFLQAEACHSQKNGLNDNEKLDLLIEQSECYKQMDQLDQAMRLLSEVINAPVISSERIKAMFLRAEIYALQGRNELALKQLLAVSQQEGEWATKAKTQLERINGM